MMRSGARHDSLWVTDRGTPLEAGQDERAWQSLSGVDVFLISQKLGQKFGISKYVFFEKSARRASLELFRLRNDLKFMPPGFLSKFRITFGTCHGSNQDFRKMRMVNNFFDAR